MKKIITFVITALLAACFTGCTITKNGGTKAPAIDAAPSPSVEDNSEPVIETFLRKTPEPTPEQTPEPTPEPTPPEPTPYTPPIIQNIPEGITNPFKTKYGSPTNEDGSLKNDRIDFGYGKNKEFQPPTAPHYFDMRQFNGYHLGDITQKEIYLTWDEGYEYGFTPQILDTLLEKDVKAAFFVTKPYIKSNPELIKRMVDEGHIVANHTATHKPSVEQSDEDFRKELEETARYFNEVTGRDMDKYFRFPAGVYSARTLSIANDLGYKSIFWSLTHVDWNVDKQPGKQAAFNAVANYHHNGCIILLHAVSESNTQAIGDIIDYIRSQGYVFKSLDELPSY